MSTILDSVERILLHSEQHVLIKILKTICCVCVMSNISKVACEGIISCHTEKVWREAQDTDEEGKKRMKEDGGEGVGKGESGGDGEGEVGRGSGELGREETLIEMADVEGVQSAEEGKSPNKVAMDTGD